MVCLECTETTHQTWQCLETDLVISLGARFDDRVTGKLSEFAKYADIIHVDIDAANIGKLVDVDFPIVGDVTKVLEKMLPLA